MHLAGQMTRSDLQELDRLEEFSRKQRVVLDFGHVQYLPYEALGALVNLKKRLAFRGRLVFRNVHPDLREVFRMTRLDQVFEINDRTQM